MTRELWLILIVAVALFVIWRLLAAAIMLQCIKEKGRTFEKKSHYFAMCFLFGLPAYLYVVSLPDFRTQFYLQKILWMLKYKEPEEKGGADVAWKVPEWHPESPKKGRFAEAFLREILKTPEEYRCDTLVVVKEVPSDECFVCKQKQGITKFCRIKKDGEFNDVSLCADCINAFIEYNPKSVFDLDSIGKK